MEKNIRRRYQILILLLIFLVSIPAQARKWTDAKGRTIEADFVGADPDDDSKVVLEKKDGKTVSIPVFKLSAKDQKYITDKLGFKKTKADPQSEEESANSANSSNAALSAGKQSEPIQRR